MIFRDVGGHDSARFLKLDDDAVSRAILVPETGRDLLPVGAVVPEVGEPSFRNRLIIDVGFVPAFIVFGSELTAPGLGMERAEATVLGLSKDLLATLVTWTVFLATGFVRVVDLITRFALEGPSPFAFASPFAVEICVFLFTACTREGLPIRLPDEGCHCHKDKVRLH